MKTPFYISVDRVATYSGGTKINYNIFKVKRGDTEPS